MKPPEKQLHSVSADLLMPSPIGAGLTIAGIAVLFAIGILWSYFAMVVEVASGAGRVIPERRVQVVQSLEGGVVLSILARSGDHVEEGDVITRFDPTSARAARDESAAQIAGLEVSITSLKAQLSLLAELEREAAVAGDQRGETSLRREVKAQKIDRPERLSDRLTRQLEKSAPAFDPTLQRAYPAFVQQSRERYMSSMSELASSIVVIEQQIEQKISERRQAELKLESLKTVIDIAQEEEASLLKLRRAGAAGQAEVNEAKSRRLQSEADQGQTLQSLQGLEAGLAEIRGRLAERIGNFRVEVARLISELDVQREAAAASLAALDLRTANTEIRASATGIIKTMKPISVGQVLKPGEDIAEIVPSAGRQLIEVKVLPEDIAFVTPGMPAIVKLSAYDYSIFGSLSGVVEQISSDSTMDEKGSSYYLVDVRTDAVSIERHGVQWPVKVGMVATVDIVTGKRSVFQYLTKPIHRMSMTAFRER